MTLKEIVLDEIEKIDNLDSKNEKLSQFNQNTEVIWSIMDENYKGALLPDLLNILMERTERIFNKKLSLTI